MSPFEAVLLGMSGFVVVGVVIIAALYREKRRQNQE